MAAIMDNLKKIIICLNNQVSGKFDVLKGGKSKSPRIFLFLEKEIEIEKRNEIGFWETNFYFSSISM